MKNFKFSTLEMMRQIREEYYHLLQAKSVVERITFLLIIGSFSGFSVGAISSELTVDELLELPLEELMKVTIVTGTPQSLAKAPGVASVITAKDIEDMGARDLNEVLETVPGLHVSTIGNINRPLYYIRGIASDTNPEVLMLINGIPITAVMYGDRGLMWAGMPLNMIARIEVIRGPGSAVYGADAFAGVINILTKTKDDIQGTEVGTRIGSFKTYEGWALHGGTWKGIDLAASLEYRTTDGQTRIVQEDAQTQYDKLFGTHVSLAPGSVNLEGDSIDVRLDAKKGVWQARAGYQGRRNIGTGPGFALALDPQGHWEADRTNADLTYHNPKFTPHWDVTAQLSYLDIVWDLDNARLLPPGAFGGTYPEGYTLDFGISERHTRLDTFAFYSGFQTHLIRLGAGYHRADQYDVRNFQNYGINPATGLPIPPGAPIVDVSNTPYAFNKQAKRQNEYVSVQDTWTIANEWELTGGLRYDKYSDFGGTTNPRAALVWQPRQDFTTKLMYGKAFRTPSFAEMYNTNNRFQLGNPSLKPETLNTWELAFDYDATQNLQLATNLFIYDIDDKIVTMPTANESRTFKNVGHWKGQGLELEARWKMNAWFSLQANYSYAKASNQSNGNDIGKYPQQSAYLRTDWLLIPNWYLDLQAKWIADRQRSFGDPRPAIADYTTVDLTLRYKDIRDGWVNVAFGIRNLLNVDAREPSFGPDSRGMISIPDDLPLAKRSLFLEFRYRF